ncbi:hypothetical protein [Acrocarpospora catenulata]|uniref:hypothetical protein n=1 Tax=Acrocarpospora catenulata TaxID=2836182 RepID=UPI001BDB4F55|nr:hypothetical protein [Acrocarpospora catenulata]
MVRRIRRWTGFTAAAGFLACAPVILLAGPDASRWVVPAITVSIVLTLAGIPLILLEAYLNRRAKRDSADGK